jgi:hypothetical protein
MRQQKCTRTKLNMMAVLDAISNIIPGWWVNGSCRKRNVRVIGQWWELE